MIVGKYYTELNAHDGPGVLEEEILYIIAENPLHYWDKQLCLTHPKDCENPWYHGCGSRMYITDNDRKFKQYDREVPLQEEDFTELNHELQAFPYTFELINGLKETYRLGRIRIMVSIRKTALTWHKDTEDRIHIPVVTHPGCRMVIEDESFHMSTGKIWKVSTNGHYHSAFNGSPVDERIHIVGTLI